jgi:hypothetical protein
MVGLYSLAGTTTARKEAATRMARNTYEKRLAYKTRAVQISATREQAAADADVFSPKNNVKMGVALEEKAVGGRWSRSSKSPRDMNVGSKGSPLRFLRRCD